MAYGLWTSARWAWWGGVILSGLLTALGVLLLYTGVATGFAFLARRPYPAVDVLLFAVSVATLAAAFVLLLLPSGRQAVATGRRNWRA